MPRRKKNASRSRQRTPSHVKAEKQLSESQKKKDKKHGGKQHHASSSSNSNKKHSNRDAPKKARFDHRLIGQKVEGKLERHAKGFGFLIPDNSEFPNVYLAEEQLLECLNRDRILVKITETFQNGEKFRGQIVQILSHEQKEFLGALRTHKGGALVVPSDPRDAHHIFRIKPEEIAQHKLKNGDHILARIEEFPAKTQGLVSVVEQVEQINSPSSDTLRILVESSWPRVYSSAATKTAADVAKDWQTRFPREAKDLRKLPFVTIDGADARDFDDAVLAEALPNGRHKFWVAIADVSFFVETGSDLDVEAFSRSTSAYFPDHVVPMLPEVLSTGVCSLNPNEDRGSLVCEAIIDPKGRIESYTFYEALIKSHKRMTYELMQNFMDKEASAMEELKDLQAPLETLAEVYKILRAAKMARGALDMDIPEAKVILHKDGTVLDIQPRMRIDAHRLIEELMLAANECAARFLESKSPRKGMYRIHEQPDPDRIANLIAFVTLIGWEAPKQLETAKDFSYFLESIRDKIDQEDPKAMALQNMLLRTMQQARYSADPKGHFALANPHYTHFTSPIRRYPDLIVHRLIKEHLGISSGSPAPTNEEMEDKARHCSDQERRAMDMEWRIIDTKKCRYIEKHLGEDFRAIVTGIIEKGVFCQIEDHFIDGLIKADLLHKRERLNYDAKTLCFRSHDGKQLQLGDRITIKVISVDPIAAKIEFDLVSEILAH